MQNNSQMMHFILCVEGCTSGHGSIEFLIGEKNMYIYVCMYVYVYVYVVCVCWVIALLTIYVYR